MQKFYDTIINDKGRPVEGASIVVTQNGVPATIYAHDGVTVLVDLQTDADGYFEFRAADGEYTLEAYVRGIRFFRREGVLLQDATETVAAIAGTGGSALMGHIASGTGAVARTAQDKLREVVSVKDFGAVGDGVADDGAAIQNAIDYVASVGGGVVVVPEGDWLVGPSASTEVFDNYGAAWNAIDSALILRKNVSLTGTGSARCRIVTTTPNITVISPVSIENATISGITLDGGWSAGASGAGHGVFTLAGPGGADAVCRNFKVVDVAIKNVASYGLALQCGVPQGVTLDRIHVENTGADGFDLKARSISDATTDALGNKASNISVRNHGQRVTGSAGIDVRGVWGIANVQVTDFGLDPGRTQCGIRFRTKPTPGDGNRVASKSSLTNFYVRPSLGADPAGHYGIESGSDDIHISNGTIEACYGGVYTVGNANGGTLRNTIVNVTTLNCANYGFETSASSSDTTFIGCNSVGAGVAGFRDTGVNTRYIGCRSVGDVSTISTSAGAAPSQTVLACDFGNERGISVSSPAAGRVVVEPKGDTADIELRLQGKGLSTVSAYVNGARAFATDNPTSAVNYVLAKGSATGTAVAVSAQGTDANIDLLLSGKGTGLARFGTHTANADAPVTGYISIRDAGGVVRKLAVIA